jgi:rifampin ADP-ribosylating transferase
MVEPTGAIMDDPNLTNTRYPGNPTKSYRSSAPLRVTGEVRDWQGHPPETIQAMKDRIKDLKPLED